MILFVNPVPFKLTWTFSPLLDSFIDNSTVTWSDDNKKQWRNQNHCGHCDYAEEQIQEKHSKQQKRLNIKINLEIIRFTKPFLTLIIIVLKAHKSILCIIKRYYLLNFSEFRQITQPLYSKA